MEVQAQPLAKVPQEQAVKELGQALVREEPELVVLVLEEVQAVGELQVRVQSLVRVRKPHLGRLL